MSSKNLQAVKKFVEITADIDKHDKKLELGIEHNSLELKFYKNLLKSTNEQFLTIVENLKTSLD